MCQQVTRNGVTSILSMQRRRYIVEIIVEVAGVPVIADDVVRGFAGECVFGIVTLITR